MHHKKLGEVLIESGLITEKELEEALKDQSILGGKLGSILFDKCSIDEKVYLLAVSSHLGIPPVDFSRITIEEKTAQLIPRNVLWEHVIFPVRIKETNGIKSLMLAMADPNDLIALDIAGSMSGLKIEPMLGLENTIRHVIIDYHDNQYGKSDYRLFLPQEMDEKEKVEIEEKEPILKESPIRDEDIMLFVGDEFDSEELNECNACNEIVKEIEDRLIGEYTNFSNLLRTVIKVLIKNEVITSDELMAELREIRKNQNQSDPL